MESDIPSILERLQHSISEKYNCIEELNAVREKKLQRLQALESEVGNQLDVSSSNLTLVKKQHEIQEKRVS